MTKAPFNIYGDVYIPTTGSHGANISQYRLDELDLQCLNYVARLSSHQPTKTIQAVDIGGGSGRQSRRMADLGADVLLIDLLDQTDALQTFDNGTSKGKVALLQKDMRLVSSSEWPASIDCAYSQRAMNYITYQECQVILKQLKSRSSDRFRLFLSMGGLDAEYGLDYSARDLRVEDRFGRLSPNMAHAHNIHADICLYLEHELADLVKSVGFIVIKSWVSEFGSPKIIAKA